MPESTLEVVLVHGAFSDGSYWTKVIEKLHASGVRASAAQVDAQGFEADVRSLRRHLAARPSADVILVGHSYGGTLISEASAESEQVRALVYVAAAAPVAGVPFGAWMGAQPSAYQVEPDIDEDDLLRLAPRDFIEGLAHDLPETDARIMWALHKPAAAAGFGDCATLEGWRHKPCWYVVAEQDRIIPAASQRSLAEMMQARTSSVACGHMVAVAEPDAVVAAIQDAIATATKEPRARIS